jgi:hypothetical protein
VWTIGRQGRHGDEQGLAVDIARGGGGPDLVSGAPGTAWEGR